MKPGPRPWFALGIAALLLATAACDSSQTNPRVAEASTATSQSSGPSRSPEKRKKNHERRLRKRERTHPQKALLTNLALTKEDRKSVDRAVADLKELEFWRELTKHVVQVRVTTRDGEAPEGDGRLADTAMNVQLEPRPGFVCEIFIYSDALADDVSRQLGYYLDDRLATPPPTLRQFWAVILAHEVGHCSPKGQKGEAHSTEWEERVMDAFNTSRLGSS
jgi:hypothetical protein